MFYMSTFRILFFKTRLEKEVRGKIGRLGLIILNEELNINRKLQIKTVITSGNVKVRERYNI